MYRIANAKERKRLMEYRINSGTTHLLALDDEVLVTAPHDGQDVLCLPRPAVLALSDEEVAVVDQ